MKVQKQNIYKYLLLLLPLIAIIAIALIINKNYATILHEDFSANINLGKVIAEDGRLIFTHNWYYGTEIRFIHTQIIYALLFRMTSDFRIVTITSTVIVLLIFIACFYFFLRCVHLSKYFAILSFILLIPWPIGFQTYYPYHFIILYQQDYIPYLCFSFIILGLTIYYFKNKKHLIPITIIVSILTLLYSVSGTRALVSLIGPITIIYLIIFIKNFIVLKSKVFNTNKNEIIFIGSILLSCFIGLIINRFVLPKLFNYNPDSFSISFSIDNISNATFAFLKSLSFPCNDLLYDGYEYPNGLKLFELILFIINIVIIFFCIYFYKKNYLSYEHKYILKFMLFGILLTFISYCLMNFWGNDQGPRYYFLVEIFLVCYIPLPIKFFLNKFNYKNKKIFIVCMSSFSIFTILVSYHYSYNIQRWHNLTNVVNRLLNEKKCTTMYFDRYEGNVVYQLSNGKLDVYNYSLDSYTSGSLIQDKWLCKKKNNFVNNNNIVVGIYSNYYSSNLYSKCEDLCYDSVQFDYYKIFFIEDASSIFSV